LYSLASLAIQAIGIIVTGRGDNRKLLMAKKVTSRKSKTSKPRSAAEAFIGAGSRRSTIPVWIASPDTLERDLKPLTRAQRNWLAATGWNAGEAAIGKIPAADGSLAGAVLGLGSEDPKSASAAMLIGALPRSLPKGTYHIASSKTESDLAALAWSLGSYDFERYSSGGHRDQRLLKLPRGCNERSVRSIAKAVALGRDLINTPANDLGPAELAAAAQKLAKAHGAKAKVTTGAALLKANYPLIHAVGRASDRDPRLIDFSWGPARAPKVTLVGKGITFDTGGLSLKPTSAMALMKKDMGGAAAVLALASMIMDAKLKVRLRVLVSAADNNVSANSFRPGDVLPSRNGMSVEISNTDAEGRLVLADALSLADEEKPDYLISMATLTGAARVALGPDLPPLYATDDAFADGILSAGTAVADPAWRMPFWGPYDQFLKAKTGDVNHISSGPFAGSITAALFLKRFVQNAKRYAHFDIYGWVPHAKPAFPEGGEPQCARALFRYFRETFG
jgi:leucyl aminopeptidase